MLLTFGECLQLGTWPVFDGEVGCEIEGGGGEGEAKGLKCALTVTTRIVNDKDGEVMRVGVR